MNELHALGLIEASAGLAAGDFSSLEITDALLARIEQYDGAIHAYVHIAIESARRE